MGNCQAIDNATLVIQHPSGTSHKLYWPVAAAEVMKSNPGHYVALILTTTTTSANAAAITATGEAAKSVSDQQINNNTVRVTRIKLLRPTDMLILGQVYRLVTNQEVMKGLSAKKYAKMKQNREFLDSDSQPTPTKSETGKNKQVQRDENRGPRTKKSTNNGGAAKSRSWQPSLNSISEATS